MRKTIVLAYSGGLASSVAIPWLAERHGADVVAVTLDLGQPADLVAIRERAMAAGAVRAHVLDTRDEFARDFVLPTLVADALSDGRYPMATAIARPLIGKKLVELARIENAAVVAHGSSGRDGARIDHAIRTLDPLLQQIAAADARSGPQLLQSAERLGMSVPGPSGHRGDENLWGRTVGRPADDGSDEAPECAFTISRALSQTPVAPAVVEITFERGSPTGINGVAMGLVELIESLSTIAGEHGVGRLERIKHRADGTRSRVLYEAPAAVVLHQAHRELERFASSESLNRYSRKVSAAYANVIDRGEWFERLRSGLDAFVAHTQESLGGSVRVRLFKGSCHTVSRTLNPMNP